MLKSRSSSDRRIAKGIECHRKRNTQFTFIFQVFLFVPIYIYIYTFVLLLLSARFGFLKRAEQHKRLIPSGLTFQACDENNLLSFESLKEIFRN